MVTKPYAGAVSKTRSVKLEELREALRKYRKRQIIYNDPHVEIRCTQRGISKEKIEKNVLNPEKLVHFDEQPAKYPGETKGRLWFRLSGTRYLLLPCVMSDKSLYIITAIIRHRKWKVERWMKKRS